MDLVQAYRHLLNNAGITADDKGFCYVAYEGVQQIPWMHDKKHVVLPTNYQLDTPGSWDERVLFHPLAENAVMTESDMEMRLRRAMLARIGHLVKCLLVDLMTINASTSLHDSLDERQRELVMFNVGNEPYQYTDDTINYLKKVLDKVQSVNNQMSLVYVTPRRRYMLEGTMYHSVAVTTFPIIEQIDQALATGREQQATPKLLGVSGSREKIKAIRAMICFVFPQIEVKDSYSAFSVSTLAPRLLAMLSAFSKVHSVIHELATIYETFLGERAKMYFYDEKFLHEMSTNADLIRQARLLPSSTSGVATQAVSTPAPASVAKPAAVSAPQSVASILQQSQQAQLQSAQAAPSGDFFAKLRNQAIAHGTLHAPGQPQAMTLTQQQSVAFTRATMNMPSVRRDMFF